MTNSPDITLIGCGKMGSALLAGWLKQDEARSITVIDPQELPEAFQNKKNITHFKTAEAYTEKAPQTDMFVLAVKPQIMEKVCHSLAAAVPHDALVASIAAGKTIKNIEDAFNSSQPVVRAMPNTPAAIGKGMTVAVPNDRVTPLQKKHVHQALQATGDVEWVDDENLMDAVTAISGSGPAYFFRFTEALAEAGEKLGLDKDMARKLARKTFEGSAALSEKEADTDISTLRENVTSPGGTTEAALNDMNKDEKLQNVLKSATKAAQKRGRDLSQ